MKCKSVTKIALQGFGADLISNMVENAGIELVLLWKPGSLMTDGMRPEDWSTAAQQTLTLVEGLPPILYSTHLWTVGVVQSCSRGTGADSSFKVSA